MSGPGAPTEVVPSDTGLSVTIVASRWHETVMDGLIAGATSLCEEAGAKVAVVRASGAFEVPLLAANVARNTDAVVALAVVIRGGTPHFDYVCNAVTDGLTQVALNTGVPVGFGVLTCDTEEQALDRAGLEGSIENKGRESALAAIDTALTLAKLQATAPGRGLGFGR
ncbi:MAG: 6,7-dimethyl-8-ribityllumazine synthase [Actinobacteria bacterium]|nr:6,7-dimethyl-8-ribityllumazine synthase [Actinomycetota bacterium]